MPGLRMSALLAVVALAMVPPGRAQETTDGKQVFQTYCAACHTVQPGRNLVGPTLFGVKDPAKRADVIAGLETLH